MNDLEGNSSQGHRNCRYSIGYKSLSILVVCNNDSVFHWFREITTDSYGVCHCRWPWEVFPFQKDSSNYKTMRVFGFVCKHMVVNTFYISEVWELERFQTGKVIFKVTQGHRCWCNRGIMSRSPLRLLSFASIKVYLDELTLLCLKMCFVGFLLNNMCLTRWIRFRNFVQWIG